MWERLWMRVMVRACVWAIRIWWWAIPAIAVIEIVGWVRA